MRVLMKIEFPVEQANQAMRQGTMGRTIQSILEEQKPEAAYFAEFAGRRCGIVVVDLADPSRIPALAEPWFLAFNAAVELHPAMVIDDLIQAGPAIEEAVKRYG